MLDIDNTVKTLYNWPQNYNSYVNKNVQSKGQKSKKS